MSTTISLFVFDAVRQVLELLVAKKYQELEVRTAGVRLSAREISNAVAEYGATLVRPPDDAVKALDAIRIQGSDPEAWSVRFDLWTKQEGASDLSMELTIKKGNPEPVIEFDNLHVL